jgi:protein TonB
MDFNQPSLRFQPIELAGTSWTRWAASFAVHIVILALLIAFPFMAHQALQVRKSDAVVTLVAPAPYVPPRAIVHLKLPPPQKIVQRAPAVRFKAPEVHLAQPKSVAIQAPPAVAAPTLPETAKLEMPKIELPAAPAPEPVLPKVKVGGFGDPNGVRPSVSSTGKGLVVAKLGAFDMSPGAAQGKGASGNGGSVSVGGFGGAGTGSGSNSGAGGSGGGVHLGGFGQPEPAPVAALAARPAAPVETPVEIVFKPKPAYSAEAREKGIEGEVLLQVLFSATGQIRVLNLVRGLGFGLDENARAAAGQIRFHPGTRDGNPIDTKGTIHIVFALS